MSTISVGGSIPSNVNTLEKLVVWANMVYHYYNKGIQNQLPSDSAPVSIAEAAVLTDNNNNPQFVSRVVVPIDPNYATSIKKFWEDAQEVSNVSIGAAFTTN